MVKITVCLETFFSELSYQDRLERVAKIGYQAVEFWLHDHWFDGKSLIPREKGLEGIKKTVRDLGLEVSDFTVNSPDGNIGGSLVKPEDKKLYLSRLTEVIGLAHSLDCKKLITCTGNFVEGRESRDQTRSIIDTLSEAARLLEKEEITLMVEPLNSFVDHPGYFLDSFKEAARIVKQIDHPNIRLLYDIYHMQIMEGNILSTIEKNLDLISHFHAAGVPGRHELSRGELSYPFIFKEITRLGYDGYFGLEYWPKKDSESSLRESKNLLQL